MVPGKILGWIFKFSLTSSLSPNHQGSLSLSPSSKGQRIWVSVSVSAWISHFWFLVLFGSIWFELHNPRLFDFVFWILLQILVFDWNLCIYIARHCEERLIFGVEFWRWILFLLLAKSYWRFLVKSPIFFVHYRKGFDSIFFLIVSLQRDWNSEIMLVLVMDENVSLFGNFVCVCARARVRVGGGGDGGL